MQRNSLQYHPDYGLPDEMRLKAVRDAQLTEVKVSAQINRVSASSIYKWRKRAEDAA
jgi:transposase-like protein